MKSYYYGTPALALIIGVTLLAPTANAQLLDTSLQGSAGVDIGSTMPAEGSAGAGTSVTSDTSVVVPAVTSAEVSADTTVSSDATTEEENAEPFHMKVSQRDIKDGKEMRNGTTERADDVRSNNSLASFAGTLMRNDRNMSSVEFKDSKMDVRYAQKAKFLGFIPASMNVKVTVDEKGAVTVAHPWYAFLMSSDTTAEQLEATLAAEVATRMTGTSDGETDAGVTADTSLDTNTGDVSYAADGTLSNRTKAYLLASIQAALAANVEAAAS